MKIGLMNIALSLYNNGKFKKTKNVLDLGTKELRVSFDQMEYAFKQTKSNFKNKSFRF